MSKREICHLVIQLMGVYLFVSHIGTILIYAGSMGGMMAQSGGAKAWGAVIGGIMMMAGGLVVPVCGVLLIVFSGKIASLLVRGDDVCSAESVTAVSKSDVMGIAVACIGLYVAVSALGRMTYYLSSNIIFHITSARNRTFQMTGLIGEVVKFCLGLWLRRASPAFAARPSSCRSRRSGGCGVRGIAWWYRPLPPLRDRSCSPRESVGP